MENWSYVQEEFFEKREAREAAQMEEKKERGDGQAMALEKEEQEYELWAGERLSKRWGCEAVDGDGDVKMMTRSMRRRLTEHSDVNDDAKGTTTAKERKKKRRRKKRCLQEMESPAAEPKRKRRKKK